MATYRPTEQMALAAKRGLKMREESTPSNRGGTAVGLARANQFANRQQVIDEKNLQLRKMKTKMIVGGLGGGVAIIGLILGLLVIH